MVVKNLCCTERPQDGLRGFENPDFYGYVLLDSTPQPTRNTWPSGWRRCISRTFHGISVGGNVTSSPAATHCLCISSTSSTQTDIQTPLSPHGASLLLSTGKASSPCSGWFFCRRPLMSRAAYLPFPLFPLMGYRLGLRSSFPAWPIRCSAFRHWSASLVLPTA